MQIKWVVNSQTKKHDTIEIYLDDKPIKTLKK